MDDSLVLYTLKKHVPRKKEKKRKKQKQRHQNRPLKCGRTQLSPEANGPAFVPD